MDLRRARLLFGQRAFGQLLCTRLSGQLADGLLQAGLIGVVLFAPERAASPARIAVGFAVLLLPFTLLAPLAGVLLDRWSRVAVLRWANVARAALIAVTALATGAASSEVVVFGSALVALALNRLVLAALGAALPRTVPTDLLATGNALAPTLGTFVTVVGGGIGLALRGTIDSHGDAAPFVAASVGYLLAAGTTAVFGRDRLGPDDSRPGGRGGGSPFRTAWDDVQTGAKQIARTSPSRRALQATTVHRMLFGALTVWTIVTIRFVLDGTSSDEQSALAALASVALAAGLGLVAAAAIAPTVIRRLGARTAATYAMATGGIGAAAPWLDVRLGSILVTWMVVPASAQLLKITVDTVLQRSSPDQLRGRVFIAYDLVFNVSFVVGVAVVAALPLRVLDGVMLPIALTVGFLAAAAVLRASDAAQWEP